MPAVSRARAAPLSLRRADPNGAASRLRQRSLRNQGGTAMPATREAPSRLERLPSRQDSAAGKQHDYAAGGEALSGGGWDQIPPPCGKAEVMPAGAKPRPGQWAVRAVIKAGILEHRLQIARLSCGKDDSCEATAGAVATLIQAARDACQVGQLRRRLLDHWWGTSQEQAYQSLHAAEILLVDLASPDEVEVTANRMQARARSALRSGDPRRRDAEELAGLPPGPVKRLRLKDALAASHGLADQAHVRLRNFRNVLCMTTLLIVILMSLFVVLVSRNPSMVPFCFTPSARPSRVPQRQLRPGPG